MAAEKKWTGKRISISNATVLEVTKGRSASDMMTGMPKSALTIICSLKPLIPATAAGWSGWITTLVLMIPFLLTRKPESQRHRNCKQFRSPWIRYRQQCRYASSSGCSEKRHYQSQKGIRTMRKFLAIAGLTVCYQAAVKKVILRKLSMRRFSHSKLCYSLQD
ncbi:Uncharacterised protein [Klebsiella pneumoniae]|uniref:Uncharacterized protein n=1 Tax=Klebsiella pneumoniae TaxID=573 RepID=A0A2X1QG86_KLEPN|nr:Uncharacterised protein [Klebsiella pneumoniae]